MRSGLSRSNLPPVKVILKRLTNQEITKHTCPQLESLKTIKIVRLNASLPNASNKENQPPTKPSKPKQIVKKVKHQSVQTVKEDFVDYRDIKRFIFYCCDQCDFKAKEGSEFKSHLATNHEEVIKEDVDPSPSHSPPHAMFTDDEDEANDDFIWETTQSSSFNLLPTIQDVPMFEEMFREEEETVLPELNSDIEDEAIEGSTIEAVEPMEDSDDKNQVDLHTEKPPKKTRKRKSKTPLEVEEDEKKYEGITFADLVTCKRHYCLFCFKPVTQIHRHLWFSHRDVKEVKLLKKMPAKEAKLERLRLKILGNHQNNVKVLEAGSGTLMITRKPGSTARVSDYGPCPHCKGWYLRRNMKDHLKTCSFYEDKESDEQHKIVDQLNSQDITTQENVTLNELKEVDIDAHVNVEADPDFDPDANADVDAEDDDEQHEGIKLSDFENCKKHYCIFCFKPLTKIHRHFRQHHSDEQEVKNLKEMPAKEASLEKMRLKLLGDHQNNVKVLEAGFGTLLIARKPKWDAIVADYGPCPHCKGWYLHHTMKGHLKNCHFNENKESDEQHKIVDQLNSQDITAQANVTLNESKEASVDVDADVDAEAQPEQLEGQPEQPEGQPGNQDNTTLTFVNLSELKQELASPTKTNRKPLSRLNRFACVKCFIDFPNILRLMEHLEEHKSFKIFLCEDFIKKKCLDTYNNFDEFKKHVKKHFERKKQEYKKFKTCLVCSETFDNNEDFVEHIDDHEGEELKCSRFYGLRCYFTGESVEKFKEHFMCHFKRHSIATEIHNMVSFEIFCRPCIKTLRELCGLANHLKLKHPEQLEFKCKDYFSIASLPEQCQSSYLSSEELVEHIKLHLSAKRKENPYRCPKCQKIYETRAQFVRHDR